MSGQAPVLFGRCWSVGFQNPDQEGPGALYTNLGASPSPLRIVFDVDKSLKSTANKALITLYNLSELSRASLGQYALVTLAAGYDALVSTVFLGVVQRASTERQGPDILTKLECGDGEPALANSQLDRFFAPAEATLANILQACAQAMALVTAANPSGLNAGIVLGIPRYSYPRGFLAQGPVKATLDYLCKNQDLAWSIQNGALDIVPKGAHAGVDAVLLNARSGLLGVPSLSAQKMQFSALLNPAIAPNRLVQIDSLERRLSGFYKINSAKYKGDTHQSTWQVECEATKMPSAQSQSLPAAQGFNFTSAVV